MSHEYDLVVIGAGPGGYVAAIRASQLGFKTAVIEKEHLGGICLNWGCIPTKALLRTSEINHLLHSLDAYGFKAEKVSFDLKKIIDRSRGVATQLTNGVRHLMKKNNIDEAIYVGDTQGDFEACEMANIPMIFASYGFGKVENPAYTINDIKELPSLMAKINTK